MVLSCPAATQKQDHQDEGQAVIQIPEDIVCASCPVDFPAPARGAGQGLLKFPAQTAAVKCLAAHSWLCDVSAATASNACSLAWTLAPLASL